MNQINIRRPDYADGAELLGFIVLAIGSIFLTKWRYGFVPIIAFIGGIPYAADYAFTTYNTLLDATFIVSGFTLVYAHAYTVKFIDDKILKFVLQKSRSTNKIKNFLFVDKNVDKIYKDKLWKKDDTLTLLANEENKTINYFADVNGTVKNIVRN